MHSPVRWLQRLAAALRPRSPACRPGDACERCPLGACGAGTHATIICVMCHALDAQRLRTLGVFAGARVRVVDTRGGMVLDVRGSRLAIGHAVASGITVCPIGQ